MHIFSQHFSFKWLCAVLCLGLALARPAAAQQSIDPAATNPGYAARKQQAIPPRPATTNGQRLTAAGVVASARAVARPACFEPFDTTTTGGATLLPRNDDGSFGPVNLGFNFSLFGTIYNQVYINTNGNLTFGAPSSVFTASGFPINVPMIAAFWSDVETSPASSGRVSYQLYADRLVVTWSRVGYFSSHTDKKNTFQIVLRANTAPTFTGNDVLFSYDDMQWTTGDASGGSGGFGGTAATVGVNKGDGSTFIQTGRFNLNSAQAPNVPTVGTPGGINYLDGLCLGYQVRGGGNVPPAVAGFPVNNTLTVTQGQTTTASFQFSGPETNQTVNVTTALGGLCNTTATVVNNNTANPTVNLSVTGASCNLGTHTLTFTALDNGTPLASQSTFTLTVVVMPAPTLTAISPTSGLVGTSVTLTGTNLTGATAVRFNGTLATTFAVVNATTVTATVPAGATTGPVTVTTPNGTTSGVTFTVVAPVVLTTASPLPGGTVGVAYSQTFQATGGSGTYTFTVATGSALPPGFTLASNGSLSGTPTGGGTYTFTVQATDNSAAPGPYSGTRQYTISLAAPTITVAPNTLPSGMVGMAYSQAFTAAGGTAPYSYALVAGTLPAGLALTSTGTLAGTPTASGTFAFTVRATDASTGTGRYSGERSYSLTIAPAPVVSGLSVQYQTGDLGQPTDNQLRPFLQLVNSGTTAVPYSSLTVRYWLTPENFMGQLVTPIDWAKLGTSFVSARYVQLATPRQGALGYIEYSFAAGAGSLVPGTNSGPIYGKAYKPDYTNFNETDDWSYQTSSSFTTNSHVTLYQNGTLINGTEPPAVASTTSIRVYAGNQDTSPTTSYLSLTLQVGNVGNRPVNYSDLTVRYYFTRDGATTLVPTVDYAKLGANNISVRYVPLATPLNGADGYLEFGFSAALGVFYPLTNTDNILIKLRKGDYTAFTQTNDYSFSSSSAVAEQPRVPAYLNGTLVFGTEPTAASAIASAQRTALATATATTPASASRAALENILEAYPNPVAGQLQLRFALAHSEEYTLAVYDGQGRLVQRLASGQATAGEPQVLEVPTTGYANGLYLVRLTTASEQLRLKFVKH